MYNYKDWSFITNRWCSLIIVVSKFPEHCKLQIFFPLLETLGCGPNDCKNRAKSRYFHCLLLFLQPVPVPWVRLVQPGAGDTCRRGRTSRWSWWLSSSRWAGPAACTPLGGQRSAIHLLNTKIEVPMSVYQHMPQGNQNIRHVWISVVDLDLDGYGSGFFHPVPYSGSGSEFIDYRYFLK